MGVLTLSRLDGIGRGSEIGTATLLSAVSCSSHLESSKDKPVVCGWISGWLSCGSRV